MQFKERSITAECSLPDDIYLDPSSYRKQYVAIKAKQITLSHEFKHTASLISVINCVCGRCYANLRMEFISGCSDKFYAQAIYSPDLETYLLIINKDKVCLRDRAAGSRAAGPLYHELGHIMLGHLQIPSFLKSKEEMIAEDLEACEFARLLLNAAGPAKKHHEDDYA